MNKRLFKNINSVDVWSCCQKRFWKYSALVLHIEKSHLAYTFKAEFNLKGRTYKYKCDHCKNIFLDYNTAINYYLTRHTIHCVECNYCNNTYTNIEELKNHTKNNNCIGKYPSIEWSTTALKGSETD